VLGNDEVRFRGRFGGTAMDVRIPVESILAVYARETGQGMIFPEEGTTPSPSGGEPKPPRPGTEADRLPREAQGGQVGLRHPGSGPECVADPGEPSRPAAGRGVDGQHVEANGQPPIGRARQQQVAGRQDETPLLA